MTRPTDSTPGLCTGLGRRDLMRASLALGAAGLAGAAMLPAPAGGQALTRAQRDQASPEQILSAMQRGNTRFREGERKQRRYLEEQQTSAAGQFPAAVILSCIDSRAPAEVIMDLGIGDIFNCRIAGNIANDDILGSMEFACKAAGAKVVLVMGHTRCGAVKGAIDHVELGNLTGLLAKIQPAVQATAYDGQRTGANYEFVDAVARTNVGLTIQYIRAHSPVLDDLEDHHNLVIAGAMYDISTAGVDFFPSPGR